MICPKHADMRARFAVAGVPIWDDGFPVWPGPLVLSGAKAGSFDNSGATGLLRANGFTSSWTVTTAGGTIWSPTFVGAIGPLIAAPVASGDPLFPLTVSCNGGATDPVTTAYGVHVYVDSFTWYLSQRSDGLRYVLSTGMLSPTGQPQYFNIAPLDGAHSGTVVITVQSTQVAALFPGSGGTPPTDAASLATLFHDCALYVSRDSDQAYQWAPFTPRT
jgi:hypothetical protein